MKTRFSTIRAWLIAAGTAAMLQATTFADSIEDSPLVKNSKDATDSGDWGNTLRMLAALVVVAVLLWVAYRVLTRLGKRSCGVVGGSDKLRVLEVKALSVKHSAVLLKAGRKVFLVGVSPSGVSSLGEITDPDEIEELIEAKESDK